MKFKLEKEMFPHLKKSFNDDGYEVYPEVPLHYRGVDLVAVKENEHIAVEMKLSFTKGVVWQAMRCRDNFHKTYVAVPVKIRENTEKYDWCVNNGIGILQVQPMGTVVEVLESTPITPRIIYDFDIFEEKDDDEGGLPTQRGVSVAKLDLKRIKKYVTENPTASWDEIYDNVQTHYAHAKSLKGSMRQWQGFNLDVFKANLPTPTPTKEAE